MAFWNQRSPDCSRPENAAVVNAAMATPATSAAQAMARRFRLTAMPAASGRRLGPPGTAWDRDAGQVIMMAPHAAAGGSVSAATAAETASQLPKVATAEVMVRRTSSANGFQSLGSLGFPLRCSKTSQWQLAWQRLICQANACGKGH